METLTRFNRLIQDLLRADFRRNNFQPWEVDLLLDIEAAGTRASKQALIRYQKAVQRQMEKGAHAPLKFSEYLEHRGAGARVARA